MSDYTTSVAALRTTLQQFTTLPIYYPNDDRAGAGDDALAGYVFTECRLMDERQMSLGGVGGRLHRDYGEMLVLVCVPRDTRAGAAEQYATQIRQLFLTDSVPGVVVTRRTIDAGTVETSSGRFFAIPLRIEWFSDRTE